MENPYIDPSHDYLKEKSSDDESGSGLLPTRSGSGIKTNACIRFKIMENPYIDPLQSI